ncbi:hypothetical protein FRC20_006020 [Serendipita sp. 405]|nr:hypothetical protein FRC15_005969 [Serendipita sp. 397]KAG8772037.1 hypothetical protein FRC16_005749 [Serendipita sp. 398]KAG8839476.1 hypothetical protein FRC20_006020 [Serendipita sp. 405]
MFYCLRLLGHHEVWVKVEEGRQVETLSYRYDSRGCRSELPTGQVTYNELIPPLSSILVRPLESFQSFRVHPQKAVKWRFQEPPSELASTSAAQRIKRYNFPTDHV